MKKCFKCGKNKELEKFYKHPMMTDGHLNKCIECAKKDVQDNYLKKIKDIEYVEKERKRGRDKYKRLQYKNKKRDVIWRHQQIRDRLGDLVLKEEELHHWNYDFIDSLFIINRRLHKKFHLITDKQEGIPYYFLNKDPLNTKEKTLKVLIWINRKFLLGSRIVDCEYTKQDSTRTKLPYNWGIYKVRNRFNVVITRQYKVNRLGSFTQISSAIATRDKFVETNDIPYLKKFEIINS